MSNLLEARSEQKEPPSPSMYTYTIIAGIAIAADAIAYFYMRNRRGKLFKSSSRSSGKSEITL
ncbi:MAG: hypothetical protein ACREA7_03735 [Nitrosotalea sp.]